MGKRLFVLLLLLFCACEKTSQPVEEVGLRSGEQSPEVSHVKIIAHRGVHGDTPENSLKSIEKAFAIGLDVVEFDVQLSKDGEIMIFHDEKLERMTGKAGTVEDYTKEELQTFHLKKSNGQFAQEVIPTLKEVFDMLGNKINYYIEIKFPSEEIEEKLLSMVKAYDLESKVSVLSFSNGCLKRISDKNKSIPCRLLLYTEKEPPVSSLHLPDYSHLKSVVINKGMVNYPILLNLKRWIDTIEVYTLDTVDEVPVYGYSYIQSVITDDPEYWLKYKKKNK
ncbi:glycerophosphoryl diester phosphodiesterase [Parabacteroides sp. PFB2-10]|uniref:glycerophosphodiester phosphodiesterase n=1 Tax=Parabacteroides sp. PFB2-10 TaxID=1742405 RepID=UPI0024761394|nr:glycerophosphodiester phosphodiesterase family protein [Parabacteroides sp. PFB2-10]MDH6313533.1 glycerophosphoryl diester phosphodiesterase [Parabacteroides sp. PFB2-10]